MLEDSFLCGFEEYIPYTHDSRKIGLKIFDLINGKNSKIEIQKSLQVNGGTLSRVISELVKKQKIKKIGAKVLNGKLTSIYDRTN